MENSQPLDVLTSIRTLTEKHRGCICAHRCHGSQQPWLLVASNGALRLLRVDFVAKVVQVDLASLHLCGLEAQLILLATLGTASPAPGVRVGWVRDPWALEEGVRSMAEACLVHRTRACRLVPARRTSVGLRSEGAARPRVRIATSLPLVGGDRR